MECRLSSDTIHVGSPRGCPLVRLSECLLVLCPFQCVSWMGEQHSTRSARRTWFHNCHRHSDRPIFDRLDSDPGGPNCGAASLSARIPFLFGLCAWTHNFNLGFAMVQQKTRVSLATYIRGKSANQPRRADVYKVAAIHRIRCSTRR